MKASHGAYPHITCCCVFGYALKRSQIRLRLNCCHAQFDLPKTFEYQAEASPSCRFQSINFTQKKSISKLNQSKKIEIHSSEWHKNGYLFNSLTSTIYDLFIIHHWQRICEIKRHVRTMYTFVNWNRQLVCLLSMINKGIRLLCIFIKSVMKFKWQSWAQARTRWESEWISMIDKYKRCNVILTECIWLEMNWSFRLFDFYLKSMRWQHFIIRRHLKGWRGNEENKM